MRLIWVSFKKQTKKQSKYHNNDVYGNLLYEKQLCQMYTCKHMSNISITRRVLTEIAYVIYEKSCDDLASRLYLKF